MEARAGAGLPDAYRRWRHLPLGRIVDDVERRLLLDLAGDLRGATVLDLGCGDGALLDILARNTALAIGIDPDGAMIDLARQRLAGADIPFRLAFARGEALPFADASFDRIFTISVLCVADRPDALVGEATRLLKPGGRLVLADLGAWSLWAAWRRSRGMFGHRFWREARFHTLGGLSDLARGAGLTVAARRGCVYFPPWTVPARLLAPFDRHLAGILGPVGAAFLALAADKPKETNP